MGLEINGTERGDKMPKYHVTCPECGWPMVCVSTASIPPTLFYECFSCGYKSKLVREPIVQIPLPMEYRRDAKDK